MPIAMEPASAAGEDPGLRWRASTLCLGFILVLGATAYANALGGPMVFDDLRQVRDNPLVQNLGAMVSLAGLRTMPTRFVGYLSFALNHWAGGAAPLGYHAVNVAIHLATALLVYALVQVTFRTPRLRDSALAPDSRVVGFVAAVLFVAHPIETQAVTYIVQRFSSLAALLYLAAVVLYARWRLCSPGLPPARRAAWYVSTLLAALLAAGTKEIAVTLPLAVGLYELCFFGPGGRRRWLSLLPLVAIAALIPLARLGPGDPLTAAGLGTATRVQTEAGRLEYLLTQAPVIVSYLFLLLLPIGQSLDHDFAVRRSMDVEVASAMAVLAALFALALFLLRRTSPASRHPLDPAGRLAAFGILWWFVALSVESSFIPIVDVMNEHRVYLPSVGAFSAMAVGILFLARRLTGPQRAARSATIAGAALGILLAAATVARNSVWSSDVSLWADAAQKAPLKARPILNLGTALVEAGRIPDAIGPLRRAVTLDPSSSFAHAQLAAAFLAVGRPSEAEPELREALRLSPADPEATFNLAMLLWESRRADEAGGWFRRFLEIAPAAYADARRFAEAHAGP